MEYVPIGHFRHCDTLVRPVEEEYDPGGQFVQEEAPLAEYVPARQLTHVFAFDAPIAEEEVPAEQFIQL